jgi:hypothetical protein
MAVIIDENLAASPVSVSLPSGPIALTQTLHSDLGGEAAVITYTLDGRHNVVFQTPQGQVKQIQVKANIPGGAKQRTDTVKLAETGGGTGMAQVQIKQLIQAETQVHDMVLITILN